MMEVCGVLLHLLSPHPGELSESMEQLVPVEVIDSSEGVLQRTIAIVRPLHVCRALLRRLLVVAARAAVQA